MTLTNKTTIAEKAPWNWSHLEVDLLKTISIRVRLITESQITRGWFGEGNIAARASKRVVQRFVDCGLMLRRHTEAHPLLEMKQPLWSWSVEKTPPSDKQLELVSEHARGRWNQPDLPIEVLLATKRTIALFGSFGGSGNLRNCETTHDLHLTEVYLTYRRRFPRLAQQWCGEGAFPKMGFEIAHMKDPDAFLINKSGVADRIIEFAGSYEIDHLRAFHKHCAGVAAQRLATYGWAKSNGCLDKLYEPAGTRYELW